MWNQPSARTAARKADCGEIGGYGDAHDGVRMRSCGGVVGGIKTASNAQVALKILWLLGWSIGCLAQVSQDCFYILLLL